ncbi:MAG: hypothetical protein M1825_000255 [Sarcosagium campestre]|nr:MAG: hypothetical protein M1825_000255 [Sarcosagium campestre]
MSQTNDTPRVDQYHQLLYANNVPLQPLQSEHQNQQQQQQQQQQHSAGPAQPMTHGPDLRYNPYDISTRPASGIPSSQPPRGSNIYNPHRLPSMFADSADRAMVSSETLTGTYQVRPVGTSYERFKIETSTSPPGDIDMPSAPPAPMALPQLVHRQQQQQQQQPLSPTPPRGHVVDSRASPTASDVSYITIAPYHLDALTRQAGLFTELLNLCTRAAGNFWANEQRSMTRTTGANTLTANTSNTGGSKNNNNGNGSVDRRRTLRAEMHAPLQTYGPAGIRLPRKQRDPKSAPALFDHLHALSSIMWNRRPMPGAPQPPSASAAQTQIVHRMGNLYAWGGTVTSALESVQSGQLLQPHTVNNVSLAARDLCAWCLAEDEKQLCEIAWRSWQSDASAGL